MNCVRCLSDVHIHAWKCDIFQIFSKEGMNSKFDLGRKKEKVD